MEPAAGCKVAGGFRILRPALIQDRPDHGALHRSTHATPLNRGTGVQQCPLTQIGNGIARRIDAHQDRLRRQKPFVRGAVRRFHLWIVDPQGKFHPDPAVARGGRAPIQLQRLATCLLD